MFRCMAILLALLVLSSAEAKVEVRLLETFPPGQDIRVAPGANIYLRIAYAMDTPVKIWVKPYLDGKPANAGSSPSPLYSGEGEMLGWFFPMQEGVLADEVRVVAGDGSYANTPEIARWPLQVRTDQGARAGAEPAWVSSMRAEAAAAEKKAFDERESEPVGIGDALLFGGFMLVMAAVGVIGLVWPVLAWRRWQGGWRIAALVPAAWIGFVILRIIVGGLLDPTSHNLWPFEILMTGASCLAVMLTLSLVRWWLRVGKPESS